MTTPCLLQVIFIDEGHFFTDLREFCNRAVDEDGKHVIVAGLDSDFERNAIGQVRLHMQPSLPLPPLPCHGCNVGAPVCALHQLRGAQPIQVPHSKAVNPALPHLPANIKPH